MKTLWKHQYILQKLCENVRIFPNPCENTRGIHESHVKTLAIFHSEKSHENTMFFFQNTKGYLILQNPVKTLGDFMKIM